MINWINVSLYVLTLYLFVKNVKHVSGQPSKFQKYAHICRTLSNIMLLYAMSQCAFGITVLSWSKYLGSYQLLIWNMAARLNIMIHKTVRPAENTRHFMCLDIEPQDHQLWLATRSNFYGNKIPSDLNLIMTPFPHLELVCPDK